mgnify:CR=1 FL=1
MHCAAFDYCLKPMPRPTFPSGICSRPTSSSFASNPARSSSLRRTASLRLLRSTRPAEGPDAGRGRKAGLALVSAKLKRLRHRPAPPPGHPYHATAGWPGEGAGRCRNSTQLNPTLKQPPAIGHRDARVEQHDLPLRIGEAERQDLRHHRADLARGEVDHCRDLPSGQVVQRVMFGDLRR